MLAILSAVLLVGAVPDGVAGPTDPLSKANRLPQDLEQTVQKFQTAVVSKGYEVSRGYWRLWSADDCRLPLQTVGFCYGNNPTAPYVLAFVPPWKDEFVDQSLHHAIAEGQRNMVPNYRLGEREALVVFAELPPPARYFGYGTNVFTRHAQIDESDPVYIKLDNDETRDLLGIIFGASPNPDRLMMLATIGDTINNVVIAAKSEPKEIWGQQRFFVTTADEAMAVAMKDALGKAGVNSNNVFTERVSPSLVSLGYKPDADDFITYIRYSIPNEITPGNQWREQLPLTILRVRDPKGGTAEDAFAIPEYEAKTAHFDERTLAADLGSLVAAVQEYWHQNGTDDPPNGEVLPFKSLTLWVDLVGQHCLGHDGPPPTEPDEKIELPRGPMGCLGDNQDDEPHISGGTYGLDDDQVIAVVGTLGTKTGNATYTSLSVNWFPELVGVVNRDDPVLEGSAEKFKASLSDPDLHTKFYVYYFARDCSGLYPSCQEIPKTLVPRGGTIKILQRDYINPGSMRAPYPQWILAPVSIEFAGGKGKRPTM